MRNICVHRERERERERNTHTDTHGHTQTHMRVLTSTCTCTYIHTCTYRHIHTHTQRHRDMYTCPLRQRQYRAGWSRPHRPHGQRSPAVDGRGRAGRGRRVARRSSRSGPLRAPPPIPRAAAPMRIACPRSTCGSRRQSSRGSPPPPLAASCRRGAHDARRAVGCARRAGAA